jgi:hypothetical protein
MMYMMYMHRTVVSPQKMYIIYITHETHLLAMTVDRIT